LKNRFISSITLLVLLNLLVKPVYVFVIEPAVQNRLGNIDFGFYFSLFGFTFIFNTILDLGVTHFNNRDIARHPQLLTRYFNRIIALKSLLSVAYIILLLSVGWIAGYTLEQFELLMILILNQILSSFILYLRSNITALHLFKTDSLLSVTDKIIMIALSAMFLWSPKFSSEFTIFHFVCSQTASYVITAAIAFTIVFLRLEKFTFAFDREYFVIFIRKSFPFALLIFLMASYKWFDSFIIERILPGHLGREQAGVYAQSFRLLDGVAQYSYLFSIILLPMFSRMIKKNQTVFKLMKVSSLLLLIPVFIVSIASFFYRREIIMLFYHQDHHFSSTILGILMVSFAFISSGYIFGTLLTANGNLKQLNMLAGFALGINVILNLLLIPKYYALGCAIANISTQVFMATSQFLLARKFFKIRINPSLFIKAGLLFILLILISWLTYPIEFPWILKYLGIMLLGLLFAFIMRLIRLEYLHETFLNQSTDSSDQP